MFLPLLLSLSLAGAPAGQDAAPAQTPPASTDPLMADLGAPQGQTQSQTQTDPGAVDLGDLVVDGRRLDEVTREFVREVGAPARGRGLARWRNGVCVGVANLQNDAAQYIVDRVSTVAEDLGLRAGEPGCEPSVLIIAVTEPNEFTRRFVEMRPRLFLVGGGGMDLGRSGLEKFKTNDQPIRWWTVSVPANADTGEIATRLPGEQAPTVSTLASRLTTSVVDDTRRVFVILDVDKTGAVSIEQLADYVAMVVLAQVDPQADTSRYATVLNVFKDPNQTAGLTDWDRAYLEGLYDAARTRQNHAAHQNEVAASIVRAHCRISRERDAEDAAAASVPDAPAPAN